MILRKGSLAIVLAALISGCGGSSSDSVTGGNNGGNNGDGDNGGTTLSCSAETTALTALRASTGPSPLLGETVTVKGVVHAVFAGNKRLGGFYIQALKAEIDDQADVSQGVFVHDPSITDVKTGQEVIVQAVVANHGGEVQLRELAEYKVCRSSSTIIYKDIEFPLASLDTLKRYEGMAVRLSGLRFITNNENLGAESELTLATELLRYPTDIMTPGTEAYAHADSYDVKQIVLDDGSFVPYPISVEFPPPELMSSHTARIGDRVLGLEGTIGQKEGEYRFQPTSMPIFAKVNERPRVPDLFTEAEKQQAESSEEPLERDASQLRVATVNLWFYQPGTAGFVRQRPKITALLRGLDADVYALQELPNNGTGPMSAVADLVNMLNEAEEGAPYAYVAYSDEPMGQGELSNALVYRQDRVSESGVASKLDTGDFNGTVHTPAIAQTFTHTLSGKQLTIVGTQLAERTCTETSNQSELLRDREDGQGCASLARREGANSLINWAASKPTGVATAETIVLGDFNAYRQEEPIQAFAQAGYTSAADDLTGIRFTHVENGLAGTLDYAFIPNALTKAVVTKDIWQVNADEPKAIDFTMTGKKDRHHITWYDQSAFRAAERNPVVVRFDTTKFN
ncbi:hypothetical protein CWE15_07670 [Aliidiomarina taiwanensis]|uniref:Endonuclease/exonuclease/phosphatase domain-containing protein n=1 Tax=Aliidiomarina taiwanensis TaxID=946228 RepID=A0A432X206_9GAMM|nr:ExeM/NucH family extracellular endonuclease [Aliidiomarina taiwanensis]RUO40611.1 hypothetical protein CWE15_07670 [Aliidiomarina taiwanensis]